MLLTRHFADAPIAQLAEQRTFNPRVQGSIPCGRTVAPSESASLGAILTSDSAQPTVNEHTSKLASREAGESPQSSRYAPPLDLTRFAWLSIIAAVATLALKAGAAWITGSVGLLSDALETITNLVAAIVALISLKIANRPPDHNHHFGHSKAEYFSALVEGVMIFVAAALIIYTAIERIINPYMPESLGIGLLISVVASVVNGGVALILRRAGRQHRSATLVADAAHLFTDVVTSAAVLVGVGLVWLFDLPILDPIVALLAGLNIMWSGFKLLRDSTEGLMDIALPPDEQAKVEAVLDRHRADDLDFHALRTRESGNRRFMSVHVLVPGEWSVQQGHDYVEDLIDEIVEVMPDLRVDAHLEPIEDARSYEDQFD